MRSDHRKPGKYPETDKPVPTWISLLKNLLKIDD